MILTPDDRRAIESAIRCLGESDAPEHYYATTIATLRALLARHEEPFMPKVGQAWRCDRCGTKGVRDPSGMFQAGYHRAVSGSQGYSCGPIKPAPSEPAPNAVAVRAFAVHLLRVHEGRSEAEAEEIVSSIEEPNPPTPTEPCSNCNGSGDAIGKIDTPCPSCSGGQR
jgi:hypothetical protein